MGWACRGCANHRGLIVPPHPSCRTHGQLCHQIDLDLARKRPGLGLAQYAQIAREIEIGFVAARLHMRAAGFPVTGGIDFVEYICRAHWLLFGEALPEIAGRLRLDGEEAHFGGEGRHRREGSPANRISSELFALYDWALASVYGEEERGAMAQGCAIFLQRFFRTHPFVDGNGRVGRLLVEALCESGGRWSLKPWTARRRYVTALEYAHRYADDTADTDRGVAYNPYRHLRDWLLQHIEEKPETLDEAEIG